MKIVTPPTLDEFRKKRRLTDFEKLLIQETWDHFRQNGNWPILREVYSKYSKPTVYKAIADLTGNVGSDESHRSSPWRIYRLTLLGALLTKDGLRFRSLLLRYLEFQRDAFKSEPLKSHFKPDEIRSLIKVSDEEFTLLGQLLSLGHLGGSEEPRLDWGVSAMHEAEDFSDGDLSSELDRIVFRYYNPELKAFEHERRHLSSDFSMLSGLNRPFIDAGESSAIWAKTIPNTAFIIMWMDEKKPELADVVNAIKEVCLEFKIKAIRADDVEHQNRITDVILKNIREAEILIADLTGERPNVYYEVGYAHAIDKRPILFRKTGTGIHFDLSGHNVPAYSNISDLKTKLRNRLEAVLGRKPKKSK